MIKKEMDIEIIDSILGGINENCKEIKRKSKVLKLMYERQKRHIFELENKHVIGGRNDS